MPGVLVEPIGQIDADLECGWICSTIRGTIWFEADDNAVNFEQNQGNPGTLPARRTRRTMPQKNRLDVLNYDRHH